MGWSDRIRIQDHSDHGKSKEAVNPWPEKDQSGFVGPFDAQWSEWSWITDPDPDHTKGTLGSGRHGKKTFKMYFGLNKFNYGNLIVIYHTLNEICTSNLAVILTTPNHCLVSSVIETVCNKFKLWKPYTHLLTQYSRTKITLLLFSLILSVKRGWRCIRVCHWGHRKWPLSVLTSVRNKRVDFMNQIWAFCPR